MNARTKADETAEKIELKMNEASTPQTPEAATPKKKRRASRLLLMIAVPAALVVGGGYVWATGGRYQETENANLRQARISVTAEVSGRVIEANVSENEHVRAGDVLFEIDPEPYRIALAQADAALAAARLQVEQLRAGYQKAVAEADVAGNEVDYLQSELGRQESLTDKGIGTKSALDSARHDLTKAKEQYAVAQQGIASARAALAGNPDIETDDHPAVMAALAARENAAWKLGLTTVVAAGDGVIAQASSFKEGQMVSAGTALFTLVETGDSWIDANFKETQLTHMKKGQKAEVWIDAFPDSPLEATIDSIGAGTGAEFSLLPAQNATGNWVKVTQRIPVRLRLEANDDLAAALRTGMSATVEVDTGKARGLPDFASLFGSAVAAE
ncbi:HlyD family secretion protein [Aquibium sp. LZ166]|uniref:HlyD family secretion protein n=1 Tax=Aquibium pacificus TaxID=3153579 RepID=A0ABV3SF55_9HYPH